MWIRKPEDEIQEYLNAQVAKRKSFTRPLRYCRDTHRNCDSTFGARLSRRFAESSYLET
jgi:hypothetical protein